MSNKLSDLQRYEAFCILEKGKFSNGYYTKYKYSKDMLNELREDGNEAYCAADNINRFVPVQLFQLCNDTKLIMGPMPWCVEVISKIKTGDPTPINGMVTYWEDERVQFRVCLFDCRQKGWIQDDLNELETSMSNAVLSVTDGKGSVKFISQDELITRCRNLSQADYEERMSKLEPDWMWISRAHYAETGVWRDKYWNKVGGRSLW